MKKTALTIITCFFLSVAIQTQSYSQTAMDQIQDRMDLWFEATNNAHWDTILNMTYEKIFEMLPKEQMIKVFDQMKSMGMSATLDKFQASELSEPIMEKDTVYYIVKAATIENIIMSGPQFQTEQVVTAMTQQFNSIYGEENVEYQKEQNTFKLTGNKTLIAVAPKESTEWKFLEYDSKNPMQDQMLKNIFPESVLTALKQ